jgi:hypothetical protein
MHFHEQTVLFILVLFPPTDLVIKNVINNDDKFQKSDKNNFRVSKFLNLWHKKRACAEDNIYKLKYNWWPLSGGYVTSNIVCNNCTISC